MPNSTHPNGKLGHYQIDVIRSLFTSMAIFVLPPIGSTRTDWIATFCPGCNGRGVAPPKGDSDSVCPLCGGDLINLEAMN